MYIWNTYDCDFPYFDVEFVGFVRWFVNLCVCVCVRLIFLFPHFHHIGCILNWVKMKRTNNVKRENCFFWCVILKVYRLVYKMCGVSCLFDIHNFIGNWFKSVSAFMRNSYEQKQTSVSSSSINNKIIKHHQVSSIQLSCSILCSWSRHNKSRARQN